MTAPTSDARRDAWLRIQAALLVATAVARTAAVILEQTHRRAAPPRGCKPGSRCPQHHVDVDPEPIGDIIRRWS